MGKELESPGVYSATYSGIPVYEYQFGVDLKEHVMRRRHDNWINATHILKAAGFDKPARTRILEREVQKDTHEKIQGGYGKYQGTWIPLPRGEELANRNNVYDRLRPIFEYMPGDVSPPPAPRHASKAKAPRAPRPAVPKWNALPIQEEFDSTDVAIIEDDTPDNMTVASASYAADDDHHDLTGFPMSHRKRKREEIIQDLTEQQHSVYGDELLDYFLLSRNEQPAIRPDPPTNFQPNWIIDTEGHTALHWACAMGDVEVIRQLKRFGAALTMQNERGETPFMRAVSFTNCYEKQTFPAVMKELFETVDARDKAGCTIVHHAAIMKSGRVTSQSCARYYLDNILNRLQETHDPNFVQQLIDAQDNNGNTAVHLAAFKHASKCIRALLGRGAATDITNHDGVRAEDLIKELNVSKKTRMLPQRSSSPFAPDSQRRTGFRDALIDAAVANSSIVGVADTITTAVIPKGNEIDVNGHRNNVPMVAATGAAVAYQSEAATTVQARVTPLVFEKFNELAQTYDEEFREKSEAEQEARRILGNTLSELASVRTEIADLEQRIEPADIAANISNEAESARAQLVSLLARRNRMLLESQVTCELPAAEDDGHNGVSVGSDINCTSHDASKRTDVNGNNISSPDSAVKDTTADRGSCEWVSRRELAQELRQLTLEQRQAEADYVDALAAVGTSDNIEKYRRLLRSCLGPEAESLEENLDGMITMMEEEVSDSVNSRNGNETGPLETPAL